MILIFFLKGMAVGFSIAAPVGPIGVLCIRRSLAHGRMMGLTVGLGAATADAAYGCVAAFGLTTISGFLVQQQRWLALLGGIFLCYLGIRTFLAKPADKPADAQGTTVLSSYLSTFFLTLTNPATILSFVAVFAGFGLAASSDFRGAGAMACGVFVGSALWWAILSNAVSLFRSRTNPQTMQMVNRFSGLILIAFGFYALAKLV